MFHPSQFFKFYIGIVQVAVEIFDHARVIRKQVNNFHDLKLILKFSSTLISYSYWYKYQKEQSIAIRISTAVSQGGWVSAFLAV